MSQIVSDILDVNREHRKPFALKGEKTLHRTTFTPSTASPGETLNVKLNKLDEGDVYVPNSIALVFNLVLTMGHANNTVVNNLSRNLVKQMKISYGGETIQNLDNYDIYMTYQDLYKQKHEREDMLLEGVSSANMRKLRTGAGNKNTDDAGEVALANIYARRYRIPLSHEILDKHGCFNARALGGSSEGTDSNSSTSILFEITLSESKNVSNTSDNTKNYEYSLSNIELEFETIHSKSLASDVFKSYSLGKGFYYEIIQRLNYFDITTAATTINKDFNIPRRCLTGILMLFVEKHVAGARDSEKFLNPNITKIEFTISGKPNKLYSKGMLTTDMWNSVIKRFGLTDNITQKQFFTDKYAVWIDLRLYSDNFMHGSGIPNNVENCINLAITKTATTKTLVCYPFAIADAVFEVENNNLKSIVY